MLSEECVLMGYHSFQGTTQVHFKNELKPLKQFLDGHFNGSTDTIKMYSFFLSGNIIDEIDLRCDISIDLPDFSKCNLLRNKKAIASEIRELFNRYPDDDDDYYVTEQVYEENSLKQFVKFFHTKIYALSDRRAEELLQDRIWQEDNRLHLCLFKYSLEKLKDAWEQETKHNAEMYAEYNRRLELTRVKCLEEADIIGLTISGAVRYHKAPNSSKIKDLCY